MLYNIVLVSAVQFSSVTQLLSRVSLRPHGLQYTRAPCLLPTPGVYSNSCPLSHWCRPTISSSVVPFSSHLQPFLASGSFPMSQLFTSGGQSIGVSASASSEYSGLISFRMDRLDLLAVQGLLRVFSNCATAWISYTCVPTLMRLPPSTPSHPCRYQRAPGWAHCATQQLPTSCLFDTWKCLYGNATLSVHPMEGSSLSKVIWEFLGGVVNWTVFGEVEMGMI